MYKRQLFKGADKRRGAKFATMGAMTKKGRIKMAKQLLLIDGNSIVFRAFFAMHNQMEKFTNQAGLHTAAIYGFKLMLDHILKEVQPDAALVAFDAGKTTFRPEKYADYKGSRDKTPGELVEQLPYVRKLVEASGLHAYEQMCIRDRPRGGPTGRLCAPGGGNGRGTKG